MRGLKVDKKANHQANIVRVGEILPHNNADSLEIIPVGEYQIGTRKGQFKVGDLAVYIQPDSVVPQTEAFRFIWGPYFESMKSDPCYGMKSVITDVAVRETIVPEKRRRITVRKFRGEWSEGLLLPISDFAASFVVYASKAKEGTDVSDLLSITHYDPDEKIILKGEGGTAPKLRKKYPQSRSEEHTSE